MTKYLGAKLLQMLLVYLGATFITFALTHISPGDPARILFESRGLVPTKVALETTRKEMGLNDPFIIQYTTWLIKCLHGDLGVSYSTNLPVFDLLHQKIPMTLRLGFTALAILIVFSLILGVLSAVRKGTVLDYVIRGGAFTGISIPSFWLGLLLILLFVVKIKWFRITDPYAFSSVILPGLTLSIPLIGRYAVQIRTAVLEQLSQDYVIGARARGIRERALIFQYILPNAMNGIITLLALSVAYLLGGTIIVESIFGWPGLGSMAMEAISYRDYPVLQAYVLLMSGLYVFTSFGADLIARLMDPRLRSGGKVTV